MLNELRDYAAMLLQEAQEMYSADSEAEKSDDERRSRLKDTIECARQLYAQRAALEGVGGGDALRRSHRGRHRDRHRHAVWTRSRGHRGDLGAARRAAPPQGGGVLRVKMIVSLKV